MFNVFGEDERDGHILSPWERCHRRGDALVNKWRGLETVVSIPKSRRGV